MQVKQVLETKKRIKLIRGIHYMVVVLFVFCMYLMLTASDISTYGATFVLFVGAIQYSYGRQCPLTLEEHKAHREIGATHRNDFVIGVIREYLRVNIKQIYIDAISIFGFIIAGYEAGKFLVEVIAR